jgi:hypothetical protein
MEEMSPPGWGSTTRCLTGHQRSYRYTKSLYRKDYEEVNLEWGRDQRNVTKDMGSFDSKPDRGKVSATPMDPTIIGHHAQNRLRG